MEYTPERFVANLKRIPRQQWWAFAGVWAAGLFAHGYMLVNKLPNYDDITCLWSKDGGADFGRWALRFFRELDGSFSSPWMLGLLSLLYLAAAAMFLADVLRLESPLFCFLAGAVLAVFPTVVSAFTYMFTSDAYMFSVLAAIMGAWFAIRGGWWRLAAVGCIVFSLGLYQGFFGWTAALMIYSLLARSLADDADAKRILTAGLWHVGVLAAGLLAYFGVTWLILRIKGLRMVSYQNLDQMGRLDLRALPGQVLDAFRFFFGIAHSPSEGICTLPSLRLLLAACQWLGILLLAADILRQLRRGRWLAAALASLLAMLMPIGINIIHLMNAGNVYTLMVYPMCMIPLVFLARGEAWCARLRQAGPARRHLHALGRWACAGLAVLLIGRYAIQANEAYLCMQVNHTRRLSYWTGVLTRIRSLPEYDLWCPVVFLHGADADATLPDTWDDPQFEEIAGVLMPMHVYSDETFLSLYLGFWTEYPDPAAYENLPEVRQMPHYPDDGSVRMMEDRTVVVKF